MACIQSIVTGGYGDFKMIMTEADWERWCSDEFYESITGMDPIAAAGDGLRVFVFASRKYLEANPGAKNFVAGSHGDFECIRGSYEEPPEEVAGRMYNPLLGASMVNLVPNASMVNLERHPQLKLAEVTADDCCWIFGPDFFSWRFPRCN